jgi:hypothetical protein
VHGSWHAPGQARVEGLPADVRSGRVLQALAALGAGVRKRTGSCTACFYRMTWRAIAEYGYVVCVQRVLTSGLVLYQSLLPQQTVLVFCKASRLPAIHAVHLIESRSSPEWWSECDFHCKSGVGTG